MRHARVLLADDHPVILDGIRTLLNIDYTVVGSVADGGALIEAAQRLKPELIILDITMPVLNGIDAAREIRRSIPDVKLLFVTMHSRLTYLQAALEVGANGYALKSAGRRELLAAVSSVLEGKLYVTPGVGGESEGGLTDPVRVAASRRLSLRERNILQLVAEGKSRKEIAFALGISETTVAFHKNNLKRKLGLATTAELTRFALDAGLV